MKSVLISVRPQWCEKIANGEKTIEVRKSRPKLETPFKCYIYQTKPKDRLLSILRDGDENYGDIYHGKPVFIKTYGEGYWSSRNQKVIGEFVCDEIYQYSTGSIDGQTISSEEMQKQSCLTYDELFKYENSAEPKENCIYLMGLYGWHISALQIYDKPKELSEFYHDCGENPTCDGCKCLYVEDNESVGHYEECCSKLEGCKPIIRAPQSWCYCEGAAEAEKERRDKDA